MNGSAKDDSEVDTPTDKFLEIEDDQFFYDAGRSERGMEFEYRLRSHDPTGMGNSYTGWYTKNNSN